MVHTLACDMKDTCSWTDASLHLPPSGDSWLCMRDSRPVSVFALPVRESGGPLLDCGTALCNARKPLHDASTRIIELLSKKHSLMLKLKSLPHSM